MSEDESRPTTGLAFSDAEMTRRAGALDRVAADAGADHVVLYGANRAGSAVQWLTGWPVTREACAVHTAGEPDALLVQFYNHVPQAGRLAHRARTRWAGPRIADQLLDELSSRGAGSQTRVGVVGALPYDVHAALADRHREVVDLNAAYTRLRMTKSTEEVERLRVAAELTDRSCAALCEAARPGSTDYDLAAAVENSYVALGGTSYIHYFALTSMTTPTTCVPEQWPTGRVVHAGDLLSCELSTAVAVDYPGQLLRTFTVAADPTPLVQELHDVADAALHAVEGVLRPGRTPAELVEAASVIEEAGFTTVDDLVHGLGGGYLPPVLGSRSRTLNPLPELVLEEGMTLVVQPNVTTTDHRIGVQTGELLHVTATGCERLHEFPRGLRRVG